MIHPDVEEAFEQIDAAMFSGDVFMTHEGRTKLREYLKRWNKFDSEINYYAESGMLLNADGTRSISMTWTSDMKKFESCPRKFFVELRDCKIALAERDLIMSNDFKVPTPAEAFKRNDLEPEEVYSDKNFNTTCDDFDKVLEERNKLREQVTELTRHLDALLKASTAVANCYSNQSGRLYHDVMQHDVIANWATLHAAIKESKS